ncbi:hypothetical protein MXD59_20160 [Frankia sp. Ag45/Mut15]|uniref:DUF4352 domain-containing protein n=1 Tax=Frankia umida TaxID=573489 RepID=A0ABT0K2P4_9ACTN|nr:hypothetical protein [Frankia umida]MCK9878056.1 hypothetical protein [Frankia umida]
MPGYWDATIKSVYAVEQGTENTLGVVKPGGAYDILADVEVGGGLISFGGAKYVLTVTVRNQSTYQIVYTDSATGTFPAQGGQQLPPTASQEIRVAVPDTGTANEGDVLDVIATFRLTSGVFTNATSDTSPRFVVSNPL